jgi:mannose-6-phosphate isomerase-like protein (cupin superfamily)
MLSGRSLKENKHVTKPWGYYLTLDEGEDYWVKKIVIQPNERLSLQTHENRREKWVCVKGTLECEIGDDVFHLNRRGEVTIPAGVKHRADNIGLEPAIFIEIATGIVDESDIFRIEDDYGRASH